MIETLSFLDDKNDTALRLSIGAGLVVMWILFVIIVFRLNMIDLSCSLLTILSLITFVGLYYIIRVENKGDGKKGFTGDREGEAPEITMGSK